MTISLRKVFETVLGKKVKSVRTEKTMMKEMRQLSKSSLRNVFVFCEGNRWEAHQLNFDSGADYYEVLAKDTVEIVTELKRVHVEKNKDHLLGVTNGMDRRKLMHITEVLNRAGIPKKLHNKRMNQARDVLGDMRVWPANDENYQCQYDKCEYNKADLVLIRREDEQRVFEMFTNKDWLLGATN
jgi:hypothetical protein